MTLLCGEQFIFRLLSNGPWLIFFRVISRGVGNYRRDALEIFLTISHLDTGQRLQDLHGLGELPLFGLREQDAAVAVFNLDVHGLVELNCENP